MRLEEGHVIMRLFIIVIVLCQVVISASLDNTQQTTTVELLDDISTNINGYYVVKEGHHYANKSTVAWGFNNETYFSVRVSLSTACATYNSSSTCDDNIWYFDWNKLWGKLLKADNIKQSNRDK